MFIHFLEKEGNEHTVEFFQRLEQNGEVIFYTGASNRKTGQRYYWKIRKNTSKKPAVAVPGLMSEEEEAKIRKKDVKPEAAAEAAEAEAAEATESTEEESTEETE
jgi:hypothetical protein